MRNDVIVQKPDIITALTDGIMEAFVHPGSKSQIFFVPNEGDILGGEAVDNGMFKRGVSAIVDDYD